jgi:signal peptidase II
VPRFRRTMLLLLAIVACVACDQATKTIARATIPASQPVSLLHDTVVLTYTENPGAFLSIGARLPDRARLLLFTALPALVIGAALVLFPRSAPWHGAQYGALALLVGGGLGNLLDRLGNHGAVRDFLRIGVGPFATGVFNLADVAIVAGVIIWIVGPRRS